MKFDKLTFGYIMQPNILFYDENVKEACYSICNKLRIDNMPAIKGNNYYELENGVFQLKEITQENKLDVDDLIFHVKIIEKFEYNRHNVLFVFEGDVLKGIVHLSDYNDDVVIQAIQDDLLKFERNLRHWYELNEFRNNDIIDFFQYRLNKAGKNRKSKEFWKKRLKYIESRKNEMNSIGEFQLFDFKEILLFGSSRKSKQIFKVPKVIIDNQEKDGIEVLSELRNLAMHGKDPVELDQQKSIYNLSSLQAINNKLKYFKEQYLNVLKLIHENNDFVKSIQIHNQNKLRMIHNHHPKALEYFISKK